MTRQEIFDKVVAHFAVQRVAAAEYGMCMYRTPDGRKCAIGALIPDEAYNPNCEAAPVSDLFIHHPKMMQASGLRSEDQDLLSDLQVAHDDTATGDNFLVDLSRAMRAIARKYGLDASSLVLLGEQGEW
jgi:hypothetical protein